MASSYTIHNQTATEPTHVTSSLDSIRTDLSANSRDIVVGEQWLVLAKVGEGSFGEVFEARDIDTGRHYAIKREPSNIHHPQLEHESIMYDVLAAGPGIPQCHWYGQHDDFNCIVVDLLGPSFKQLRQTVHEIPLDIVVGLGVQMVSILEHIHNRGIIYRDVKPDNFLFAAGCHLEDPHLIEVTQEDFDMPQYQYESRPCRTIFDSWPSTKVYVVDYGLATYWRDPKTKIPYPEQKRRIRNKTGTARYASLNVHRGKTHARRDDLESISYLLLDMVRGSLPWTGIQARNSKAGWDRMKAIKEDENLEDLCAGLPRGILDFLKYTRKLSFAENPDYDYLRGLLKGSLDSNHASSAIVCSSFEDRLDTIDQDPSSRTQPHPLRPPHEPPQRPPYESPQRPPYDHPHKRHHAKQQPQQQRSPIKTAPDPRARPQYHRSRDHSGPDESRQPGHPRPPSKYNNHGPHARRSEQQEGVFDMDDLAHDFSSAVAVKDGLGTPRNRRGSAKYNGHGRRTDRSASSNSSAHKFHRRRHQTEMAVGWNTHKHDKAPWNPETEWTVKSAEEKNMDAASWGENQPDATWGTQANVDNAAPW